MGKYGIGDIKNKELSEIVYMYSEKIPRLYGALELEKDPERISFLGNKIDRLLDKQRTVGQEILDRIRLPSKIMPESGKESKGKKISFVCPVCLNVVELPVTLLLIKLGVKCRFCKTEWSE